MAPLVEGIQNYFEQFVFMPNKEAALVTSVYVVHTWNHHAAYATPYMYYHSPEKQSGKTRCLEVLEVLVRNPMLASSITDAALFRAIHEFDPTLVIDEVDMMFHGQKNTPMQAVLNSGYRHSGSIWRVVQNTPYRFKTFCPKVLSGINNLALPDTVRDRAIPIRMRRKPKNVAIEPFYLRDELISEEREHLMVQLEKWSARSYDALKARRTQPIEEISDRQWEISEPLVLIAGMMGIEDEVRAALIKLFEDGAEQQGVSEQQQLLIDIAAAFKEHGMKRISSRNLLEKLGSDMTGKKLANQLACYGVHPKTLRIRGNEIAKGYEFADFKPIFESYL